MSKYLEERRARLLGIAAAKEPEKPKPIAKKSKKRAAIDRKEYAPKARKFIKDHPMCQAALDDCTGKAQCVHHKKGKNSKDDLLDEKYWLAVCFNCHRRIEDDPQMAKDRGLSISRHKPAA